MKNFSRNFSAIVNDMPAGIEFTIQGPISKEICPQWKFIEFPLQGQSLRTDFVRIVKRVCDLQYNEKVEDNLFSSVMSVCDVHFAKAVLRKQNCDHPSKLESGSKMHQMSLLQQRC